MEATTIYSNEEKNFLILSVGLTPDNLKCQSYLEGLRKRAIFESSKELLFKASLHDNWVKNTSTYPVPGDKFTFNSLSRGPTTLLVEHC